MNVLKELRKLRETLPLVKANSPSFWKIDAITNRMDEVEKELENEIRLTEYCHRPPFAEMILAMLRGKS